MSRPARRPRIDHRATAATLRDQPGVWLHVGDYRNRITADNVACVIRYGSLLGSRDNTPYTPAGAYEARTVLVEDVTRVEARYIGEGAAS